MKTCKNCGYSIPIAIGTSFCPSCGQQATVSRFDSRFIVKMILDAFDYDRGFLFTVFQILYRPGKAIREYIDGKRINFYNPVKLFLITGTAATVISVHYRFFGESTAEVGPLKNLNFPDLVGFYHYSGKYFTFFSLDAIPFFALFSWYFFRYTKINFTENLIMNLYAASGQFLLTCFYAPVLIFYSGETSLIIYGILNQLYNIWTVATFFKVTNWKGLFRAVVAVLIPSITVFFLNYGVYRLSPTAFWKFLDLVFS